MKIIRIPLPSGTPEKGFNCEAFFNREFAIYMFKHAEIVKIDGEIIDKNTRGWILATRLVGGEKCTVDGYVPSLKTFLHFERKRIDDYKDTPNDPLSHDKVEEYKKYLKKLSDKPPCGYKSARRVIAFYLIMLNKHEMFKKITCRDEVIKMVPELSILSLMGKIKSIESMANSVYKQLNENSFLPEGRFYNEGKFQKEVLTFSNNSNVRADHDFALKMFQDENPGFSGLI